MSQVGSAFVVVKPLLADFRSEVAQGVNRAIGSTTIPLPVTPTISRGSTVTWEKLATGAAVPKVVPLPVQPTISPAARAQFAGQAQGIRGLLLGAGQGTGARALGIGALAGGLFLFGKASLEAIKSAANLEQELNVFQQVAGATADQMTRVREEARKLGADVQLPAVSAGDAAATMTDLAKAGLSVNEVLAGTRGTLQLATAASLDFASAAELSANALNSFQLPGTDAVKVADLLAGAANAAQGDIADFGIGLSQVGAVAHQAGLTLQETVTFLTEFAKAGIQGSDAGTSLRVALLRLIAPTKEAQGIFDALGVDLAGFQSGRIRAPEFFADLRRAMEPLDKATRNAALATVFGTDAIRVASIAVRDSGRNWDTLTSSVGRAGQAQEAADARTKGFSGSVSGLASNLETLGADLGSITLPALTALSDLLSDTVKHTDDAIVSFENFSKAAVGGLSDALADLGSKIGDSRLGRFFGDVGKDVLDAGHRARLAEDSFLHLRTAVEATGKRIAVTGFTGAGDRSSPQFDRAVAQAAKAGDDVGKALTTHTASEITKHEREVINAAKRTVSDAQAALRDVVAEGARAVEASAVEAKQSLTSIGQGLASSVVTLLDTGTLAQRITDLTTIQDRLTRSRDILQSRLDRSQQGLQRGNLRKALRDAREELARAEEQVAGPQNAEERAGANRFLRPLRENVKDAQAALAEFDQQTRVDKVTARIDALGLKIGGLGDRLDAQKTRIQRSLNDIVAKFNAGLLTGPQVNAQVAALLQKNVGPMAKAGRAQGFAFRQAFTAQLEALQAQIAAILGGPRTRKTGAEPAVVKPADAVTAAAANTAAAQRSVRDAIQAVAKAQKDATSAVTGADGTNAILKDIRRELRGSPSKPSSDVKTPGKPRAKAGGPR
jgi:TP901 family phage tail tape measure protein